MTLAKLIVTLVSLLTYSNLIGQICGGVDNTISKLPKHQTKKNSDFYGVIIEKDSTKTPIPYAKISLYSSLDSLSLKTDFDGVFKFYNINEIESNQINLNVQFMQCKIDTVLLKSDVLNKFIEISLDIFNNCNSQINIIENNK